ncbi:MAG: hypothetical protein CL916_05515 [Deltaproteobacteria bacterium]|nr:hypothetical protein [Deltaproteobacteria bacterium]
MIFLLLACTTEDSTEKICPEEVHDSAIIIEPSEPAQEPEDFSMWENATLRIVSPLPAQRIGIGEEQEFIATLINQEGDELPWEEVDIQWTSDIDESWSFDEFSFADANLSPGVHLIEAHAVLPNNNRLTYALGGIKVQHPYAGIYSGTTTIDATVTDWSGNETVVSCAGAATLVVDLEGKKATGSSACILQLFGQAQETSYEFDIDINESDLSGLAIADFGIAQRDFPLTGTVSETSMSANWADVVYGTIDVVGQLDLIKVSD